MAEPLLQSPKHWIKTTLQPNPSEGVILDAESGGTPSTQNENFWDGEIPWLTPKEITGIGETIFVSQTERNITDDGLANSAAKLFPPGTVMLTKRAPVGAVAINAVPMATNQGFLNFTCGPRLRPLYLAYWLKVNTKYLQQVANGSTYRELYKSDLFEFELAIPPLNEQDAILSIINAIQFVILLGLPLEQSVISPEEMLQVQNESRNLIKQRDLILIQLFSGGLDVSRVKTAFSGGINV